MSRSGFRRADLLVNCIGIQREERLDEVSKEAFDEVVQVNLKAAMFLSQAVARHQMRPGRGRRGRQVHVLSVRAQLGLKDRGYSAYCSHQGRRGHAGEAACRRAGTPRHHVNGVAPTVVAGEMAPHWLEDPAVCARYSTHSARPRRGADDCVRAMLFFCSPGASFVTGQTLEVDGGLTATQ